MPVPTAFCKQAIAKTPPSIDGGVFMDRSFCFRGRNHRLFRAMTLNQHCHRADQAGKQQDRAGGDRRDLAANDVIHHPDAVGEKADIAREIGTSAIEADHRRDTADGRQNGIPSLLAADQGIHRRNGCYHKEKDKPKSCGGPFALIAVIKHDLAPHTDGVQNRACIVGRQQKADRPQNVVNKFKDQDMLALVAQKDEKALGNGDPTNDLTDQS